MKITINTVVSESRSYEEVDLDDLGITKEEWDFLSAEEKSDKLQEYLNESPNQPYWMVDIFNEDM